MTVYGYARVSTRDQENSGAGLIAQEEAIRRECERRGWELAEIAQDVASGKDTKGRPEYRRVVSSLGEGDVLVAAKLDRLSRSVVDFGKLLEQAQKRGWSVLALDVGVDTTKSTGRMVAGILMQIAQWERERIGERTKEALAVKKAQGVKLGAPRRLSPESEAVVLQLRACGLTIAKVVEELNASAVPGPGGGRWHAESVRRVLSRG